jgi:hypothetical protein
MTRQFFIWTTFLGLTALASCDCMQDVTGTVYDKETKQPLDSVYAHKGTKNYGEYTDKQGEFKLNAISGGLCGCPPMLVIVSKEGYEQQTVEIKNANHANIYLIKKF